MLRTYLQLLIGQIALVVAQSNVDLSWVPFDRTQFSGNAVLDTNGDVQLFWKTGDNYSTFGIASRSNGYLALGFSETGAMTGADMAVGYTDQNGTFVLENRHASGFVTPQKSADQTNNIQLREGSQKNGVTSFVFDKKNVADCLVSQETVNVDAWQWFIYAFSDQNTFVQHQAGNMGKQYVKLGTGQTVSLNSAQDRNNTQNFTVIQGEVTIPSDETTYCYTLHKMPAGKKNFLIAERPPPASKLLHHLVLYACYGLPDEYQSMVGQEPNCNWQNFSNPCSGFVTEWAPGMSAKTFEPGFGKPFGEDLYEYAMLETHYNNPEGLVGEKDSAEYTFLYTDQQVATEVGTLTLGDIQVEGWFLEPGKPLVSHSTVCTPECTDKWPSEGITAVSVFHHMHYRGRQARVQIIRDGREIAPLSTLQDFEYGYQFSKNVNNIQLLPGDRLITTCEYDTSNDTTPVPGGYSSEDEMCFAWVDYYPMNSILICSQINMGNDSSNPINGTVGMCEASNASQPDIYPSDFLTASYQALPATGENCTADDGVSSGGQAGSSPILQTCPDQDVCFSLNLPEQSASSGTGDMYFRLSAPTTYSWVALAQGTMMSNANIFVMYSSADGQNVTVSPRLTSGHVMPTHNDAAEIVLLEGSGISNGKMVANVRCSNCSSWRGGSMSFTDASSNWVYAHLSGSPINSDDSDATISQHDTEGSFQWDLSRASGGADGNPFLSASPNTTTSSSSDQGQSKSMLTAHGVLASIAFVALFPVGAVLVRFGGQLQNVAWVHGGIQILAYTIFVAAAGLGIYIADSDGYLREPHAIIGMILLAIFFFMPVLGAVHHAVCKRLQRRSAWSYAHIFTGRIGIILGIVNGGLGLQLAGAESSHKIAYGVCAGVMGAVYISAAVVGELRRGRAAHARPSTAPRRSKQEGSDDSGSDRL
jgi:hypothetical protein